MSVLLRPVKAAFSFWVWSSGFAWMLVGVALTMPPLVVGVPYTTVHPLITGRIFASCAWLATLRVKVHYHPDHDRARPSVYVQNHVNLLDGHIAAHAIPHAFSGLMNSWQFKIPIYGWLMRLSKGIPVRSKRAGDEQGSIVGEISVEARKRKDIGMSILTFPEGHRTLTGRTRQFKSGAFFMAQNAGMPVVPIATRGLYEANNKNMGWSFNAFRKVDVFVGPQFDLQGLEQRDVIRVAHAMRDYVQGCLDTGAHGPQRTTADLLTSGER